MEAKVGVTNARNVTNPRLNSKKLLVILSIFNIIAPVIQLSAVAFNLALGTLITK